MIYLKNPLCLGMEESEYKEMLALGGMRQKHFEKMRLLPSRPIFYSGIWIFSSTRRIPQAPGSQNLSGICYRSPCAKISRSPSGFSVQPRKRSVGGCLSICQTRRQKPAAIILRFRLTDRGWRTI